MARIVLEPIGEELDCGEDETILDASLRQGFSLVHGCREGQCSACKCYLLEGEVSLRTYSTFALSDSEEEQGYTLLCRAMPDDDEVVIELLHVDPDGYRAEHPIRDGRATVTAVEAVTRDISRLELTIEQPADFAFTPGQYVDLHVPGTGERRSFSMANAPGEGRLELLIKRYPGGRISGLLETGGLAAGDGLTFTGPYGAFRLRENDRPVLLVAGGSGMAPQLALLRQLGEDGCTRPVRFLYGARTEADLFALERIAELGARLPDFRFVPVLSEQAWDGERGMVHEALARALDDGTVDGGSEAYLCGPPPMVEAVTELLVDGRGIDAARIHFDKFTTAVAPDGQETPV